MMVGNVGSILSIMDTGCITLKPREGGIKKSTLSSQEFIHHDIYICVCVGFFLKEGVNSEIIIPAVP